MLGLVGDRDGAAECKDAEKGRIVVCEQVFLNGSDIR